MGRGSVDPASSRASYRTPNGTPLVPPGPSAIDLHSHTDRSDGLLPPDRLVADAAAAGVRLLAITDHDTLAGFRALGPVPTGIEVIPGVEINSVATGIPGLWEGELHLLGLGVDPADERFEASLAEQRRRREERFARVVARLRDLGYPIDEQVDALRRAPGSALGRPTLARALVAAGHAFDVDDAMQRLLARGKPGYAPRVGMGPAAAIDAIRTAGGLPVLAHFAEAAERRPLIEELIELGLGGLEVHYARFPLETVDALAALAGELGLIATGGGDHHGDRSSYAETHATLWIPPSIEPPLRRALAAAGSRRRAGNATARAADAAAGTG